MSQLNEILEFNKSFVESKEYLKYSADKYPNKKIVILSCMDTRLTELLPKALNLKNGDAKIIKNAGAVITHPFGSIARSILVAIYELKAEEVFIIGHHGCGMSKVDYDKTLENIYKRGIKEETINNLTHSGIDLKKWFEGFSCIYDSVKETVSKMKNHPLMPADIKIHGLVMDPKTAKLELVVDDNK